jgi:hypothetical protein
VLVFENAFESLLSSIVLLRVEQNTGAAGVLKGHHALRNVPFRDMPLDANIGVLSNTSANITAHKREFLILIFHNNGPKTDGGYFDHYSLASTHDNTP